MCGTATNTECGMNVCCNGSNYCGACFLGYYRGAPATSQTCRVVQPSNISVTKFTYLYYAFASFDASFNLTALKSATFQTWVVYASLVHLPIGKLSGSANRAKFITFIKAWMLKYGLQGVDLDWGVPGSPADKSGYRALVKEMSTSLGTTCKISMAFPVDCGDMFWIDSAGMVPYLDSIGLITYDQSNADGTVSAHTSIVTIASNTLLLRFDTVPPAKLNLGLATYSRGFTLGSTSYSTGVMALFDINDLIASKGLTSTLNSAGLFKSIQFDNQWIAKDDASTVALKKGWTNDYCFEGTMV
ncbi:putative chitinase [Calycina marina]|uniref:chitinase n=1 Tax=Calycina marina TaxID=1763456 RepID=A0A9P7ZB04_9HELO|nr:putative chitinase [Calycina marina]